MPLKRRMTFFRKTVARRVVRRAEEQQPGVLVGRRQQLFRIQRETGLQLHLAHLHVVDRRRHLVHAVSRGDRHRIVPPGFAEQPEHQVDRFVRTVADEDLFDRYALDFRQPPFQVFLMRVGVAVVVVVVRVFVGVEVDAQFALVFVPRGRVGGQRAYVFSE